MGERGEQGAPGPSGFQVSGDTQGGIGVMQVGTPPSHLSLSPNRDCLDHQVPLERAANLETR